MKTAIKKLTNAIAANFVAAKAWFATALKPRSAECSTPEEKSEPVIIIDIDEYLADYKRARFIELVDMYEEELAILLPSDFDKALVGGYDSHGRLIAVYSRDKVIEVLCETSDMDYWEALEYFEYNIERCSGEKDAPPPMFLRDLD